MKKNVLVAGLTLFLISISMVGVSSAQNYIIGVSKGDVFEYDTYYLWNSTDPVPQNIIEANKTTSQLVAITNVTGYVVALNIISFMNNGTQVTSQVQADVRSGEGYGSQYLISANLSAGDAIGTGFYGSKGFINETITKNYSNGPREVNRIHFIGNGQEIDLIYDKKTGVMVEYSYNFLANSPVSFTMQMRNSSIWTIPEFPSTTIIALIAVSTLSGALFSKRKLCYKK
jgi:hypothetical protein